MISLQTEIGGRLVEWDDNKAAINVRKHGVSFKRAAEVFLDEHRYDELDELHSDEELRYKTIGMVDNILTVFTPSAANLHDLFRREKLPKERG